MGALKPASLAILGLATVSLSGPAGAHEQPASEANPTLGSLATYQPLRGGHWGMSVGGGFAVILPFYAVELGYGLTDRLDLVGRYETVAGILHYPHVALRWSPIRLGDVTIGTRFSVNYSLFGIETDQTNLTSTLYLAAEVGASGPITDVTELFAGVGGEFDLVEFGVFDDEPEHREKYDYDATILRGGMKTRLVRDLHGFLQLRLRIPIETFRYEAQQFYVIPLFEIGGTWSW